jgi:8-amino-7-oxononanoate synthase
VKLIVVDGVFSMEGDLANLPEIVKLAKKYNANIMVDEAHSWVFSVEIQWTWSVRSFWLLNDVDLVRVLSVNLWRQWGVCGGRLPCYQLPASQCPDKYIQCKYYPAATVLLHQPPGYIEGGTRTGEEFVGTYPLCHQPVQRKRF